MRPLELFRLFFVLFLSLSVLPACERDEVTEFFVQTELQPYFNDFMEEALSRGKQLDMSRVSGVLADIPEDKVLGRCEQSSESGNKITIDQSFWNKSSAFEKEYVVFHELGHCVLDRRHLETQNADGSCVSIMQSGTSGCRMIYNAQTRDKYLDELFQ